MSLHPYLFFTNTCREAMTHYQEVLGGHLEIMTLGDMPEGAEPPPFEADPDMVMRTPDPVHLTDVLPDGRWITPIADDAVLDLAGDPADVAAARDTIRLAFVSALQRLPATQRAVLVLREVLHWPAAEVAELLDVSVAAVNSALQRARATMATPPANGRTEPLSAAQRELLARYVDAFERYDMDALAQLLHDDVIQTMPPYSMWLQGRDDELAWYVGPSSDCEGSRLLAGRANGCPAFAQYRVDPDGGHAPWALQVLELRGDRIEAVHSFLTPRSRSPASASRSIFPPTDDFVGAVALSVRDVECGHQLGRAELRFTRHNGCAALTPSRPHPAGQPRPGATGRTQWRRARRARPRRRLRR